MEGKKRAAIILGCIFLLASIVLGVMLVSGRDNAAEDYDETAGDPPADVELPKEDELGGTGNGDKKYDPIGEDEYDPTKNDDYTVDADEEKFRLEESADADTYYYVADKSDSTFVEITFVPDVEAGNIVFSFMNKYTEYTDIVFHDVEAIDGTELRGEHITATNGTLEFEAFLVNSEGGVNAIVLSYPTGDAVRSELTELIATIQIG